MTFQLPMLQCSSLSLEDLEGLDELVEIGSPPSRYSMNWRLAPSSVSQGTVPGQHIVPGQHDERVDHFGLYLATVIAEVDELGLKIF